MSTLNSINTILSELEKLVQNPHFDNIYVPDVRLKETYVMLAKARNEYLQDEKLKEEYSYLMIA